MDVVRVDIAGTVNALSSDAAKVGLYVAVGNVTMFFPEVPKVYLAVIFPENLYGSVVVDHV